MLRLQVVFDGGGSCYWLQGVVDVLHGVVVSLQGFAVSRLMFCNLVVGDWHLNLIELGWRQRGAA